MEPVGSRVHGVHAVSIHPFVVSMKACELHIVGAYSSAFPELTVMVRLSNVGETIMQVSQITRAPVASIRDTSDLQ